MSGCSQGYHDGAVCRIKAKRHSLDMPVTVDLTAMDLLSHLSHFSEWTLECGKGGTFALFFGKRYRQRRLRRQGITTRHRRRQCKVLTDAQFRQIFFSGSSGPLSNSQNECDAWDQCDIDTMATSKRNKVTKSTSSPPCDRSPSKPVLCGAPTGTKSCIIGPTLGHVAEDAKQLLMEMREICKQFGEAIKGWPSSSRRWLKPSPPRSNHCEHQKMRQLFHSILNDSGSTKKSCFQRASTLVEDEVSQNCFAMDNSGYL